MPNYHTQMELNNDPDQLAIFELTNKKIDQPNYSNWIREKREYGKRKWNKPINRNKRRIAILKKQLGYNK